MDLTYMPGELDMKSTKKGNGTDMKREHDSVDDFEHLDPDLSPGDGHVKEKIDIKKNSLETNLPDDITDASHGDFVGLPSKPIHFESGKTSPDSGNLLSDFGVEGKQIKTEVDFHFDSEGKTSLLDFGNKDDSFASELPAKLSNEDHSITKSFISAEIATKNDKTEHETPTKDIKPEIGAEEKQEPSKIDKSFKSATDNENDLVLSPDSEYNNSKSMKEDDALPQYEMKLERRESPQKDEYFTGIEKEVGVHEPQLIKPQEVLNIDQNIIPELKTDSHEDVPAFVNTKDFGSPTEFKETQPVEEPTKPVPVVKPASPVTKDNVKSAAKKISISDLDDIIGPEDVFKRIGLDAWFTPERLHPKVEALVYWRDPKKSGIVFGGGMAILLSLCIMSLISVIAYTSLLALMGTICFRIYKNILQAVQKTSEGHPFKEFLELELSLPQDKVREVVDTAVVHINAAVVELRRLFLVEDLIDSIKFGVCLWCLTYVGAIFNGMTLVILAFVALFTVPKIYENNKASIDQYIEMGRSKVAEITSKVKAAVPIGKKEPEKDKEQ